MEQVLVSAQIRHPGFNMLIYIHLMHSFTGGLIEASISLPGKAVPGEEKATFWSAFVRV